MIRDFSEPGNEDCWLGAMKWIDSLRCVHYEPGSDLLLFQDPDLDFFQLLKPSTSTPSCHFNTLRLAWWFPCEGKGVWWRSRDKSKVMQPRKGQIWESETDLLISKYGILLLAWFHCIHIWLLSFSFLSPFPIYLLVFSPFRALSLPLLASIISLFNLFLSLCTGIKVPGS